MGYGLGALLLVVGLVLALAVDAQVQGVDLHTVGWIMTLVGVLVLVLAVATNTRRPTRTVQRTTHPDGSQTVSERRDDGI